LHFTKVLHSGVKHNSVEMSHSSGVVPFGLVSPSPSCPLPKASVLLLVYCYPIIPCTTWFPLPPLFRKGRPSSMWVVIWEQSLLSSSWAKLVTKFCFGWDFHIVFRLCAPAVQGKEPPHRNSISSFFYLGMLLTSFLVLYYYLFGLAADPFSVVVRLDTGVTLQFGLSHNVTSVWPFSWSWADRQLCMATLCIFFYGFQSGPTKVVEDIDLFHMHIWSINVMN
jgi:hypothetical protein